MDKIKTKNQIVRDLVSNREYKKALGICKDWDKGIDPNDRDCMRLGYECMIYPRFYEQLGRNVTECITDAINCLIRYYGA